MKKDNAIWIIDKDHCGTGCEGRHSSAFKDGDERKCTIRFFLTNWERMERDEEERDEEKAEKEEKASWVIHACYEGWIPRESLDEFLIEFDLPHECWSFVAYYGNGDLTNRNPDLKSQEM